MLFLLSCALTGAGFLVGHAPFAVAYIPFALALLIPARPEKHTIVTALMAGHFLWPALISGWGLARLEYNPVLIVFGATVAVLITSYSFARLGIAISTALLLALPAFPASPLLVTGALLPGAGVFGLATLLVWVALIEAQRGFVARCSLLMALLATAPGLDFVFGPSLPARGATVIYDEIDISDVKALTQRGHWTRILDRAEAGDQIILGENMITHDDHAAIHWWCSEVQNRDVAVRMGVMTGTGLGAVWRFDRDTCPTPLPLYHAQIGIPMVNAGWWPAADNAPQQGRKGQAIPDPHWLICFEAFSLWRWIGLGRSGADHGVILANDRWTDPFATALLRRKVAARFAALLRIHIHHADSGVSALRTATGAPAR